MKNMCSVFAFHNALSGPFVCETGVGRRKERAMTSSGIEDDLGAWGAPSAGHPRASAHLQSFVQKTLILTPIKQDLV